MTNPEPPKANATVVASEEPIEPTAIAEEPIPTQGESIAPKIDAPQPAPAVPLPAIHILPADHPWHSIDTLPHYSEKHDPNAPQQPPSYHHPSGHAARSASIEELLPTEEERLASLQAFVEEKRYTNDFFGGHKGSAEGVPNDPFRLFRWVKRRASGEKGHTWHKLEVEWEKEWEAEGGPLNEAKGEVAKGDMDTSLIA